MGRVTNLFLRVAACAAAATALPCEASAAGSNAAEKTVIGRSEEIALMPENFSMRAKIDTGALNSSLNARHYKVFERDGRKFVTFSIVNRAKQSLEITREVVRIARIKRIRGKSQERPVIKLRLCLGEYEAETEVNLVDRSGFNYQMLIGRTFLTGNFLVDPARMWTAAPVCHRRKPI
jgi:hypothetical protein